MEATFSNIFSGGWYPMLAGLLCMSMFFARAGLRDITSQFLEGFLFLALAVFFFCAHLYLLLDMSIQSSLGSLAADLNIWQWLALMYAPSLVFLFIVMSAMNFFTRQHRVGVVKLFFGLTLMCYLWMVGGHWPADCKGILAMIYGGVWFNLELRTA
ncbi:MAG: hypothetical protein KOO62_08165 [candidate division Zixibacteria bacterium]|nr:hypothetical protein [candidate division Zixibacteria bacterium]